MAGRKHRRRGRLACRTRRRAARRRARAIYFQRARRRRTSLVLFLADGAQARVLGASRQWPAPAPGEPFRYGGCVRPRGRCAGGRPARRGGRYARRRLRHLVGLNSLDFLVEGDGFDLIEINPRPGATLDIFDRDGLLFRLTCDACRGGPTWISARIRGRPPPRRSSMRAPEIRDAGLSTGRNGRRTGNGR